MLAPQVEQHRPNIGLYITNGGSNSLSVINFFGYGDYDAFNIPVWTYPMKIVYDDSTKMSYVINQGVTLFKRLPGTVSVIDAIAKKVAAGDSTLIQQIPAQ